MYTLQIENSEYQYAVIRSKKRKKSLSLKISSSGKLEVRSPLFVTDREIHAWLITRKVWISKHINKATGLNTTLSPVRYVSGEKHYFLGRAYQLDIGSCSQNKNLVELEGGSLVVRFSESNTLPDHKKVEQLIWQWYLQQAQVIFQQRLESMAVRLPWVKDIPKLTIRKMKSRWGSCSSRGNISLNLHLIRVPMACLDQVILHELCHLKFFNHSALFYALMEQHNPLYKDHEKRLREFSLSR